MNWSISSCGAVIQVRVKSRGGWRPVIQIAGGVVVFVFYWRGSWVIALEALVLMLVCMDHVREDPAFLVVGLDAIALGSRRVAFADVTAVRIERDSIVVLDGTMPLEIRLASGELARRLEARMLLARRPPRIRAESAALEALYVFRCDAVRVRRRAVIEIVSPTGPWAVARRERIYVRRGALGDPYRSNAAGRVVEIDALR